ncbi:MAG: hypothetical protein ACI9R3_000177 [Verrucomicrobiales bacterium]
MKLPCYRFLGSVEKEAFKVVVEDFLRWRAEASREDISDDATGAVVRGLEQTGVEWKRLDASIAGLLR